MANIFSTASTEETAAFTKEMRRRNRRKAAEDIARARRVRLATQIQDSLTVETEVSHPTPFMTRVQVGPSSLDILSRSDLRDAEKKLYVKVVFQGQTFEEDSSGLDIDTFLGLVKEG